MGDIVSGHLKHARAALEKRRALTGVRASRTAHSRALARPILLTIQSGEFVRRLPLQLNHPSGFT